MITRSEYPGGMRPSRTLRALMWGLIDYAGLFPPAKLDMQSAVANFANYRYGDDEWALGRFVVPLERSEEFNEAASTSGLAGDPIRLTALSPPDIDADRIAEFNADVGFGVIDTVETKAGSADEIRSVAKTAHLTRYIEIPLRTDRPAMLRQIAQAGARAKIRTGGLTANAFPTCDELLGFIVDCQLASVPFKATAGLHHAIRSVHPLTYQPGSPSALMHGFINVFLAAALIYTGGSEQQAFATLEEQDPGAFRFGDDAVRWHDCSLNTDQMSAARENFAISFGSCSFEEPIGELREIGWF